MVLIKSVSFVAFSFFILIKINNYIFLIQALSFPLFIYNPRAPINNPDPMNLLKPPLKPPLDSDKTAARPPLKNIAGVFIFPNIYSYF